ncbi:hypothetical protein M9434_003461 [Picochlorum sp. BPE23]|nr:hypothetical protein M9434_003461 [Picochlorum sp. BPE23]
MDDTKYHYQLGNRIRWVKLADSIPEEDELWEEHGNAYDIGQDHFRCLNDEWIVWNEFPMSGDAIRKMCNNGIYRENMFSGHATHALDAGVRFMQSELLKSCCRFESMLSTHDMENLKAMCLLCGHLLNQFENFLEAEGRLVSKQRSEKEKFIEDIGAIVRGIIKSREFSELHMDLEPFGSHSSQLDDSGADVDLCIYGRGQKKRSRSTAMYELRDLNHAGKKNILLCVMHRLRSQGYSVVPIVRARVPVLKVQNKEKTVSCDIVCVCNKTEGIHKSLALRCIKDIDYRFHAVLTLVKKWASQWELRDASLQRLNSYALTQLVIFHFQTRPVRILPPIRDLMRIPWHKDATSVKNRCGTELNWYPSDGTRLMDQPFEKRPFMIDVMGDNSRSFNLHRSHGSEARGPKNKETIAELLLSFFVLLHGLSRGWKGPTGKKGKKDIHKYVRISTFHACIYVGENPKVVMRDCDEGTNSTHSPIFIEDPFDSTDNCARSLGKECLLKLCQASEKTLQSFEQLKSNICKSEPDKMRKVIEKWIDKNIHLS